MFNQKMIGKRYQVSTFFLLKFYLKLESLDMIIFRRQRVIVISGYIFLLLLIRSLKKNKFLRLFTAVTVQGRLPILRSTICGQYWTPRQTLYLNPNSYPATLTFPLTISNTNCHTYLMKYVVWHCCYLPLVIGQWSRLKFCPDEGVYRNWIGVVPWTITMLVCYRSLAGIITRTWFINMSAALLSAKCKVQDGKFAANSKDTTFHSGRLKFTLIKLNMYYTTLHTHCTWQEKH